MDKDITLTIPVFRGGTYFRECWESVRKHSHCFDRILVSLNRSEIFEEDKKFITGRRTDNLTIIYPDDYLDPLPHLQFYLSQVRTKFVFFLAHDDLIIGENLERQITWIRNSANQGTTAILGNYIIIDESGRELGIVDELGDTAIPTDRFIRYDLTKHWFTSVSGMIADANWLKRNSHITKRFVKGIRFEYFLVMLPYVSFVCSPKLPIVKIRLHSGQEGRQPYKLARASDEMLYWLLQSMWRQGQAHEDSLHKISTMLINKKPFLYWYYFVKHAISLGVPICPILRSCKQRLYQVLKAKMPI